MIINLIQICLWLPEIVCKHVKSLFPSAWNLWMIQQKHLECFGTTFFYSCNVKKGQHLWLEDKFLKKHKEYITYYFDPNYEVRKAFLFLDRHKIFERLFCRFVNEIFFNNYHWWGPNLNKKVLMVYNIIIYGIFPDQLSLTSILIPILCT